MKKWIVSQLTEPTAWICTIIALLLILAVPKGYILMFCVLGVVLDESWMKQKCNEIAPSISKKLDEWAGS